MTQTASFSGFTGADYQNFNVFAASPTATFAPFDSTLGTLETVSVTWTFSAVLNGTATDETGGQITVDWGGAYEIDGDAYAGNGGGKGNGGDAGQSFTASYVQIPATTMFEIAGFADGYDPTIYAALTGGDPITATFDIGSSGGYATSVASGNVTETATVSLDYVYSAAPTPEPAAWALMLIGVGAVGGGVRTRRARPVLTA